MSHSGSYPVLPITARPPGVAVDPNFKIDIVNPSTGAVGLQVSEIANVTWFKAGNHTRPGEKPRDKLCDPVRWATFTRIMLETSITQLVSGVDTQRSDLAPPSGAAQQALHAFIPGGPSYPDMEDGTTKPTQYTDLHDLLADILACQAAWYFRTIFDNAALVERLIAGHGPHARIWQTWHRICGNLPWEVESEYLTALYIVSIRRMKAGNTWAYFPEVEIRG